jgi:hypothetical protein
MHLLQPLNRKRSVNHRVGRHRYLAASSWREERRSGDELAGDACACGHGPEVIGLCVLGVGWAAVAFLHTLAETVGCV